AECAKKRCVEAGFAGDLSHDLHEAPAEAAGPGFGGGDFVVGVERGDVFGEKGWFVAHGPGVPAGFLFDDGAHERGVEGLGGGCFLGEREQVWWNAYVKNRKPERKNRLWCG